MCISNSTDTYPIRSLRYVVSKKLVYNHVYMYF